MMFSYKIIPNHFCVKQDFEKNFEKMAQPFVSPKKKSNLVKNEF